LLTGWGTGVEELVLFVKGSTTKPYELTFIKDGSSLTALCTCPAGQFGNSCKHRVAILDSDFRAISGDNADQAAKIVDWLAGSDVEAALIAMREAEKDPNKTKQDVAELKKKLARAMNS
jgi:uncharacterized Zn finger protein